LGAIGLSVRVENGTPFPFAFVLRIPAADRPGKWSYLTKESNMTTFLGEFFTKIPMSSWPFSPKYQDDKLCNAV
jgi:hypothetical protein